MNASYYNKIFISLKNHVKSVDAWWIAYVKIILRKKIGKMVFVLNVEKRATNVSAKN